ncbi:MAG: ATP-binding cassette domain-containing protein, partial [Angelakisella sp.]
MLKVENMVVSYGSNEVLHGISLEVREGEIVTIIGSNGAGKTTTLKAIAGLLPKGKGSSVRFMDEEISTCPAEQLVQRGIALSPEGRGIFPDLTVLENLEMGAYLRMKDKDGVQADLKRM